MYVIDPETGAPVDEAQNDAASAAAAAAPEPAPAPEPEPAPQSPADIDAAALSAFKKGAEDARAAENQAPVPVPAVADAPDEPGAPAAPAPAAAEPVASTPAVDQVVEDEIKTLALGDRAAQRFRELTTRAAEIEPLRARAERADEWERAVMSTGATPEQFGATVSYTALAVRGNAGDIEAARLAYAQTKQENEHWAKMLGMPAQGVDPLEAHPDLRDAVANSELDRKLAEELAQRRQAEALHTQVGAARTEQQQRQIDLDQGTAMVAALGAELRQKDPQFEAKFKQIGPLVNTIQETLHPSQWAQAIAKAWQAMPAPASPAPKPAPSAQPLRPTGASSAQVRKPQNDHEAFMFGVAAARAAGQ